MVSSGVEEADRLNLETFIEATDLGKLTYEACGFVYAGTNYLESAKRNASPEWRNLERDMQYVYFSICRWSDMLNENLGRPSICIACGDLRAGNGWKERRSFLGRRIKRRRKVTGSALKYSNSI